jgi:2,3-bisphosphoglycerate-independent phosphoglycerate mutase
MKDDYGQLISSLTQVNDKKIVMLVLDGLGDTDNNGKGTALQMARTPNMDKLAQKAVMGLAHPVFPGITPGSGPGHLGLFGYDPVIYQIGRGVLSALGLEFNLRKGDVAARLNFCTLNDKGEVEDRRAGRISSEKNQELIEKIKKNLESKNNVELFFETESEHRALMVLRGEDLDDKVGDTDPQQTGENGDIKEKINAIEAFDNALPGLVEYNPDVLIITGDHSTPAPLGAHSWHPVPVLLKAPGLRGPFLKSFDEITALNGELGTIFSKEIMTLAMAHAGKLAKFGA